MIELVFLVIVVVLVVLAVIVMIIQVKKSRLENTDPPVAVSDRARVIVIAIAFIYLVIVGGI